MTEAWQLYSGYSVNSVNRLRGRLLSRLRFALERSDMSKRRPRGDGTVYARTRTRKDGTVAKTYVGQITVGHRNDGKPKKETVYGKTKREVREKLKQLQREVDDGVYSSDRSTVSEYLAEWLQLKKLEVRTRTHKQYEDNIRLYIIPHIGTVKLRELTSRHVEGMMLKVAESTSNDAANKARGTLSNALNKAVRQGLIARNPVDGVAKFNHTPKVPIIWTDQEAWTFLRTAADHRLYAAFYLAASTGMRHGEVLGLRWDDIEGNVITVQRALITVTGGQVELSTPKTATGIRRIYIDEGTLTVLAQHHELQEAEAQAAAAAWDNTGFVFTNQLGGMLNPRNFDRDWYELLERSGVPRITFHGLRHLHTSQLVRAGHDPVTVADRIGHRDPSFTLKRYSHAFEDQRKKAGLGLSTLMEPESD